MQCDSVAESARCAALRHEIACGLQQYRTGDDILAWKVSGYTLQLGEHAGSPSLRCEVAFGHAFDDETLRAILESAPAGVRHFEATVLIDQSKGQLIFLHLLKALSESSLWQACEQIVNQADVWIDVVIRRRGPYGRRAGRVEPRLVSRTPHF
ncbi:hypothetical protein J2W35_004187 [Variovorax boronicumulans]|uniref:hypothetical protein n=1 Tax=Variovorax boronicumulans TaxID=436515 RepID=UPI00278443BD|nr:hypothetical protein [Variovorax boronicumulans]MDQ0083821.1 hypothetical protein [Variovorax boronicumulans]